MRAINKGQEPSSLTQHRKSSNADYENYVSKDELRRQLVKEQRGLCCYCMSRIYAENGSARIEHWHPQSQFPDESLDYQNLLAACNRNAGERSEKPHCDRSKGNTPISKNPANPHHRVEDLIHFKSNGTIHSDNTTFDKEISDVLNLNLAFLIANRKAALDGFIAALPKLGTLTPTELDRRLKQWNGENHNHVLEPYCQVVIYWLRKRIARL
jgi:uncharacterized protein (TIGR02646 family)